MMATTHPTALDWLAAERLELLDGVRERLHGKREPDEEELSACRYLLTHLAASSYGRHQDWMEPRNRE